MTKIDIIIQTLQEELVRKKKSYFSLSQATVFLKEKRILTENDLSTKYLKSILEEGLIPQATKTIRKPKQWRIHKINNEIVTSKIKRKTPEKQISKIRNSQQINKPSSLINTERTHRENEIEVYYNCPICGVNLSVPKEYVNHDSLRCYNCAGTFKNPLFYPDDITNYKKLTVPEKEKIFFEKKGSQINTERTHRENEDEVYLICPYCSVNLSIPQEYRSHDDLICYHCYRTFKNQIASQYQNKFWSGNNKYPPGLKYFMIIGFIVLFFYIIGKFSPADPEYDEFIETRAKMMTLRDMGLATDKDIQQYENAFYESRRNKKNKK